MLKEHQENLASTDSSTQSGLRLKPYKCRLMQQEVEYLRHQVSAAGITTVLSKIMAVCAFPVPTDVKSL